MSRSALLEATAAEHALFDLDGTLIDSLPFWASLINRFLEGQHFPLADVPADLHEATVPMTLEQSSRYLVQRLHLSCTPSEALRELRAMVRSEYVGAVPLKPGVADYLAVLASRGTRMCVVSATSRPLVEQCLRHLGIARRFEFLVSCEEVGFGKDRPDAYLEALRRFGDDAAPGQATVYEDATHALRTARSAGFRTVGILDPSARDEWPQIGGLCDATIRDWADAAREIREPRS